MQVASGIFYFKKCTAAAFNPECLELKVLEVLHKIAVPPPVQKVADEAAETCETANGKKQKTKTGKKRKTLKAAKKQTLKAAKKQMKSKANPPAQSSGGDDVSLTEASKQVASGEAVYQPGSFRSIYAEYMKAEKLKGKSHKEATESWKTSAIRQGYLSGLSASERKKRRFDK